MGDPVPPPAPSSAAGALRRTAEAALTSALTVASAAAGAVVGRVFGVAARVRGTKPLHPAGRVGSAVLEVTSPRPDLAVPWLAVAGTHACLVRWSRSAGLPPPLPDVEGFALRLAEPVGDLLFASTGSGPWRRSLLAPRLPGHHGAQTTILPVATAAGPLVLRVEPRPDEEEPPRTFELAVALGRSPWDLVGVVRVEHWGPDRDIRFAPVLNTPTGMRQYPWVARFRQPAYTWARRSSAARPDSEPEPEPAGR